MQFQELGSDAARQYLDAESVFSALEAARKDAAQIRGSMRWKTVNGKDYLIRVTPRGAQTGLGARDAATEAILADFSKRKSLTTERVRQLEEALERHTRMNRALRVGRAPNVLIDVLSAIDGAGLSAHFRVVGTHALYAYETAAGVRIMPPDALATQDVDLLWDVRKRVQFVAQMNRHGFSMLGLLQRVDPTFKIRPDQKYTAVNGSGFEVDILRRPALANKDPHPLKITEVDDDFWVVQANRADDLQNARRFSAVVVGLNGAMARMETIDPGEFVRFKRWMADLPDREPLKKRRDALQAALVEQLVDQYLPNLRATNAVPAEAPSKPRG